MPAPVLYGVEIPFISLLGMELEKFEGGESRIVYEVQPQHMNSFAVAHGGVIMTLLDVTLATAARSIDKELGVVTIEMKTSFMRPGQGRLVATGRLMHRTRSMGFCEGTVVDAAGEICAHATGTFKYVQRRPETAQISTD